MFSICLICIKCTNMLSGSLQLHLHLLTWFALLFSARYNKNWIILIIYISISQIYQKVARKLTDWEFPRTELDFENSYAFKVFLFQFINYYSSLFYIAFVKGRYVNICLFSLQILINLPNRKCASIKYRLQDVTYLASSQQSNSHGLFGFDYELEVCDPAGCMVELVIQLAVIMVGKQFFNNFIEIVFPYCLDFLYWMGNLKKLHDIAGFFEKDGDVGAVNGEL